MTSSFIGSTIVSTTFMFINSTAGASVTLVSQRKQRAALKKENPQTKLIQAGLV
jgi:hypothetical protein